MWSAAACSSERDPWVKRHAGAFDRVLVDAPCTGVGTWRRNPDARWKLTPDYLKDLLDLQRRILDSAARLVKPGGRLIYATCSLLPAENEAQIEGFLAQHPDFAILPVADVWRDSHGEAAGCRALSRQRQLPPPDARAARHRRFLRCHPAAQRRGQAGAGATTPEASNAASPEASNAPAGGEND